MLKQLTVPVLGLAVVAGLATPAAAGKGRTPWIEPAPRYTYEVRPTKRAVTTSQPRKYKRKFDPKLDFETEAVWRNLRPEWFD
jgi:hypothetical protein